MQISYDEHGHVISLSQESYIEQILNSPNMTDCKPAKTPLECKLNL